VFINPRFEFSLGDDDANRSLALTIDGNLAYFSAGDANAFFLSPTFGVRWYLGIGSGGIVLSQAVGTGFVTLTLPGSLAFDIALGPLHIIPEVKWDPTLFFAGDTGGVLIFFSGGASILVEI